MKAQGEHKLTAILATLAHYRQLIHSKIIDNIRGNQCLLCLQAARTRCLCADCLHDLPWQRHSCASCALPLSDDSANRLCFDCEQSPPNWHLAQAVFHYQFPIDRLIAAFKYHHQLALTDLFAELMAATLVAPTQNTLLVPVPLHPDRLRLRGYDQTGLLAQAISRLTGIACHTGLLRRVRDTTMQKQLHRDERLSNLQGAFTCAAADLSQHTIILVDDVLTTGATLSVLSQVLFDQGAKSVQALVIARTLPR